MNTALLKIINDIEKKSYSDEQSNINKSIFRNYKSIINKLFMRMISFSRLPKYYLPKTNISKEISEAQENILINFENAKDLSKYESEIEKVLARIDLRYKYSQLLLLSSLVKEVVKDTNSSFDFSHFKWVSFLDPIIHLPKDESEEGTIHQDYRNNTGSEGTRIVWLPFTDYDYPGIIRKGNFLGLIAHFSPSRIGTRILKNAKEFHLKKKHLAGHWVAFNDTFYHKGILNKSKRTSIALIARFSNKIDEQNFLPIDDLISEPKGLFFSKKETAHDQLVNHSKLIAKNLFTSLKDTIHDKYFYSEIIKLIDKNNDLRSYYSKPEIICIYHIIEYSLTIFIQRVKNSSIKWFKDQKSKSMKITLKNLREAKKIVIKEKRLLISS